jgi:predicted RNA-binding protein with PUA-like domain
MNYWLVKSEPFVYSWNDFVEAGVGVWDGVRNYQARNNLKAMQKDDKVLFYHSNEGLCVVGIAKVVKEHYPDPSTDDPRWVAVDLSPIEALPVSVSLKSIKADERLQNIGLMKQSRLSVIALTSYEFEVILEKGALNLPLAE